MTTNVNMIRKMGIFEVTQRTKDGMFNATALLKQWNEYVKTHKNLHTQNSGYVKCKDLDDFFLNNATKDFVQTIMLKENLTSEKEVFVKSRASRGSNAGTWMHPMLFIDFAMWLNPSFKYDVLKFVYDEMIKYRNLSGDTYKELASSIRTGVQEVTETVYFIDDQDERKMYVYNEDGDLIISRPLKQEERQMAMKLTGTFN